MPISRTSFERFSLPPSDWSIFRCAIERMSSPWLSRRLGALGRRVVEEDDLVLAARLRGHHRGLGAGDELARVRGVLGALGDSDRNGDPAREIELDVLQPLREPARQRDHVVLVARRHDHRELLAADPADDVGGTDGRPQVVGEIGEHLVADGMAEDVVHLLEVVDVDHHHGDVLVRARGAGQLAPEALVEVTVVVEAGERVGLRLALEPRSDVRVVEGECGSVAEPLGELELLVAERRVLADPVDVERPLQRAARDERDDDQCLRLERGAGNEAHTRVEVSLVREHRLAMLDGPAGDPLAEREALAEDLVRVLAAHERRHELALRLVRLVDVQRLVRDDLVERVGDPHEQRVEALLREQVVEDVREPAVGVDGRVGAGREGTGDEPHARGVGERRGARGFVHGDWQLVPVQQAPRVAAAPASIIRPPLLSGLPRLGEPAAAASPSIEGRLGRCSLTRATH